MGSIIRVNPANNTLSIVHKANCLINYGYKYNDFFAEANGKLYSTTQYGGANDKGVIFEYNPSTNIYTKLHDFAGSVYNYEPTSLVLAKNGKLYGTAHGGGIPEPNLMLNAGGGVLFEFDLTTNTFSKKHDFTLTGQSIYDMGIFPSGLISSTNGKLYGATLYGVFEYNPTTEAIRMAGRFLTVAAAPSFVQVCRKPLYQAPVVTTYNVCKDASFTLNLASANTATAVWKHNGAVDATRTTPELSFTAFASTDAGTWVCMLTNECGTTVAQSITLVYDTPTQPVITVEGSLTFCEGKSVTLSAPTGFSDYEWSTGETTRKITVREGGNYTVVVGNGCESPVSEAVSVTVNELPAPATITAGGPVVICNGETVLLAAPEGFIGYAWSNGQISRQITVRESGNYKVKVNDGCESLPSEPVSVTVNALPPTPGGIELLPGGRLMATGGDDMYAWSVNEVPLDDHTAQIEAKVTGIYRVHSLSAEGCRSAVSVSFVVTGTEPAAEKAVVIYPNPGQGTLNIKMNGALQCEADVSVFDATGHMVFHQFINFQQESGTIHLGKLSAGLYNLMIRKGDQLILRKIVIQ
jgi:uncharacterized repeat protein (TIGR03803 family)